MVSLMYRFAQPRVAGEINCFSCNESGIYLDAGQLEISDQVKGVETVLLTRDDVDPYRICIAKYAWIYLFVIAAMVVMDIFEKIIILSLELGHQSQCTVLHV